MNKSRLEAFSDGVLAIIITIMVLEIKVPHGTDWKSLQPLIPVFLSYAISFLFIGIYWGNHHHLLHTLKRISPGIMWANLLLLFWLSLVPVATGWMGENHFATNTVVLYAIVLVCCGLSYSVLQHMILKTIDRETELVTAIKNQDKKVAISAITAFAAIPFAFVNPTISCLLFLVQSGIWLIPDKNIEQALKNMQSKG
ncbi:MAG: DUF1211 domain-containing protein [Williamsia sp.]|nr:DUF1211 domain-containing protein [Williamsia sp.]